ncbi:hypothetical protein V2J09_011211 [Rumex salicifolius]
MNKEEGCIAGGSWWYPPEPPSSRSSHRRLEVRRLVQRVVGPCPSPGHGGPSLSLRRLVPLPAASRRTRSGSDRIGYCSVLPSSDSDSVRIKVVRINSDSDIIRIETIRIESFRIRSASHQANLTPDTSAFANLTPDAYHQATTSPPLPPPPIPAPPPVHLATTAASPPLVKSPGPEER